MAIITFRSNKSIHIWNDQQSTNFPPSETDNCSFLRLLLFRKVHNLLYYIRYKNKSQCHAFTLCIWNSYAILHSICNVHGEWTTGDCFRIVYFSFLYRYIELLCNPHTFLALPTHFLTPCTYHFYRTVCVHRPNINESNEIYCFHCPTGAMEVTFRTP